MNNDIIKLFCENPKYYVNVPLIQHAYNKLNQVIKKQFFELLENNLNSIGFEIIIEGTKLKIQLQAGENDQGFYFAYRIVEFQNSARCEWDTNKRIKTIALRSQNIELFEKYSSLIKRIIPEAEVSERSLGYYNSEKFKEKKKLNEIDVEEYIGLKEKENCSNLINYTLEKEVNNFEKIKVEITQSGFHV